MAKKKSKTQKYKKNIKQKQKKQQLATQNKENKSVTKPSPKQTSSKTSIRSNTKKEVLDNKPKKENQLVDRNKVEYNVVLKREEQKKIKKQPEQSIIKKKTKTSFLNKLKNKLSFNKKDKKIKEIKKELPKKEKLPKINKEVKTDNSKTPTSKQTKKKNIIIRLLYELKNNTHIFFNTLIIITFILMLIGFFRIRVMETGMIIYISCIALFLMAIAISYNKYISGKIFTLLITAAMAGTIYYMQYTYDFVRNLNSNLYEYKTYYVVTFDNNSNKSIYSINNKKVGLLKDNCINIERMLNTKLDKVIYLEYENINDLFNDFYSQEFRAILVNENQYKYLKNNINGNNRAVKILYEFEANAKK